MRRCRPEPPLPRPLAASSSRTVTVPARSTIGLAASATVPLLVLATIGAACSTGADRSVVDVYAASSLTDAFGELEASFEADHPDIDIRLNLAGSSALLRQIEEGAPVDVFAPADPALLDGLEPTAGAVVVYAANRLTLVVPHPQVDDQAADDQDGDGDGDRGSTIVEPADLADADVLVARCALGVPCGDATERYLTATGLTLGRSTDEPNVRSVLLKVVSGEADAGFVYVTDALARSDEVVEIPLPDGPTVELAVAALSDDADAAAFAAYVASDDAAEVFRTLGFTTP